MRTIAVASQKGGSGKTTAAVNLAAALGERGSRVLLLDLDPQASASSWLGVKDGDRGLLEVFTEGRPLVDLVRKTEAPGVDLVPSSSWLLRAETGLQGEPGAETILRKAIRKLPRDRWDFLFVDCPPSLGLLSISALVAVEEVLVSVEASVLSLEGLARLLETVELVRDRLNPELEVSAVVACRVDLRRRLAQEVVESLRSRFGSRFLRTVIRENVRLAEAPSHSKPVTLYAPTSHGAEDFRALAGDLLRQRRA